MLLPIYPSLILFLLARLSITPPYVCTHNNVNLFTILLQMHNTAGVNNFIKHTIIILLPIKWLQYVILYIQANKLVLILE